MSISTLLAEREILRAELRDLKTCQIKYFSISITATGVLVGVAQRFSELAPDPAYYLVPLIIVLPCWWVFFDKATTITRIVGYMRILEKMIIAADSQQTAEYKYIGWENSLAENKPTTDPAPVFGEFLKGFWSSPKRAWKLICTRTRHRYWVVNWFSFFLISATCVCLSYFAETSVPYVQIVAAVIVLAFTGSTAATAKNLIDGPFSYEANEKLWNDILTVN